MEIYTRHIITRVWLFRFFFIILLFISIDSFSKGFAITGYFSAVVLTFTGFIRLTGLTAYHDSVKIERYYFFSWIPVKWLSDKNQKNSVRLIRKYDEVALTSTETLADLILPFFPVEGEFQGVSIEYKTSKGIVKSIHTSVNNKEYDLLASHFQKDNTILII